MSAANPSDSLLGLEEKLRTLSHSDEAMRLVQEFAASLGKTKARQNVFNVLGALVLRVQDPSDFSSFDK